MSRETWKARAESFELRYHGLLSEKQQSSKKGLHWSELEKTRSGRRKLEKFGEEETTCSYNKAKAG
jgi:hypothetical protein